MSEAGGGLFYPDSAEEAGTVTPDMLSRVMDDTWHGSEQGEEAHWDHVRSVRPDYVELLTAKAMGGLRLNRWSLKGIARVFKMTEASVQCYLAKVGTCGVCETAHEKCSRQDWKAMT